MDDVERSDVRIETLDIFILELDVIQRSEGGNVGGPGRDDGVDGCVSREHL